MTDIIRFLALFGMFMFICYLPAIVIWIKNDIQDDREWNEKHNI